MYGPRAAWSRVMTVLQPQNVQSDSQNGRCTYSDSVASGCASAARERVDPLVGRRRRVPLRHRRIARVPRERGRRTWRTDRSHDVSSCAKRLPYSVDERAHARLGRARQHAVAQAANPAAPRARRPAGASGARNASIARSSASPVSCRRAGSKLPWTKSGARRRASAAARSQRASRARRPRRRRGRRQTRARSRCAPVAGPWRSSRAGRGNARASVARSAPRSRAERRRATSSPAAVSKIITTSAPPVELQADVLDEQRHHPGGERAVQIERRLGARERPGVRALDRVDEQRPGSADETDQSLVGRQPRAGGRASPRAGTSSRASASLERPKARDALRRQRAVELGRAVVVAQPEARALRAETAGR